MVDDNGTQDATYRAAPFPFDPVIGARFLEEIQAEGLRAAGALVDRLVHLVDGPRPEAADQDAEETPAAAGPAGVEMGAVLPWFDLWKDLVERTSDTMQRFRAAGDGGAIRVEVDGSLAPTRPLVVTISTDGTGCGEMWLHNGTPDDVGELVPRCGQLSSPDGSPLDYEVVVDPPKVDGLPARSSRGFAISVTPDPTTTPGTYRGIVQVQGTDTVWMPIEVVVPVAPA